jgi:hypothetical protein
MTAFLLSQDGPMGFGKLAFYQVVVGSAATHPDAPGAAGIIAVCKEVGERAKESQGPLESVENSPAVAEFVQAVIDGQVDDEIAKQFFFGANVVKIVENKDETFDYLLSESAVTNCLMSHDETIQSRMMTVGRLLYGENGDDEESESGSSNTDSSQ